MRILELELYRMNEKEIGQDMSEKKSPERSPQYPFIDIERLCAQDPPTKSCSNVILALDSFYSDELTRPKRYDDGHLVELYWEYRIRPKKPPRFEKVGRRTFARIESYLYEKRPEDMKKPNSESERGSNAGILK